MKTITLSDEAAKEFEEPVKRKIEALKKELRIQQEILASLRKQPVEKVTVTPDDDRPNVLSGLTQKAIKVINLSPQPLNFGSIKKGVTALIKGEFGNLLPDEAKRLSATLGTTLKLSADRNIISRVKSENGYMYTKAKQ